MTIESVTVIVPTLNEERHVGACLDTVCGRFKHVFVVDSVSSDGTTAIAEEHGARVVQHPFEGFAKQWNWALDNLPLETDWVWFLAADERATAELRAELAQVTAEGGSPHAGYYVPQRYVFLGRLLQHGGWAPSYQLRLFRRSRGRFEERVVHEYPVLSGSVGYLKHPYLHYDTRDIGHFVAKHNRYSTLEAREALEARRVDGQRTMFRGAVVGDAMRRRRWIKTRLWPRLPGRYLVKFAYQYVFRAGFLDGRPGFYFALLHAFYEAMIAAKTYELEHAGQRSEVDVLAETRSTDRP